MENETVKKVGKIVKKVGTGMFTLGSWVLAKSAADALIDNEPRKGGRMAARLTASAASAFVAKKLSDEFANEVDVVVRKITGDTDSDSENYVTVDDSNDVFVEVK